MGNVGGRASCGSGGTPGHHLGHAGARAVVGGHARVREGVGDERQLEGQEGEGAEAHRDLAKVERRVDAPVVPRVDTPAARPKESSGMGHEELSFVCWVAGLGCGCVSAGFGLWKCAGFGLWKCAGFGLWKCAGWYIAAHEMIEPQKRAMATKQPRSQ